MIVIQYSIKDLLALMECAGKNDVRYYLNGIHLTVGADFNTGRMAGRITATNGHILMQGAIDSDDIQVIDEESVLREMVLDIESLKKYVKKPKAKGTDRCEFYIGSDQSVSYCDLNDSTVQLPIKTIDGRYPEVHRVMRTAMDSPQVKETGGPISAHYLKIIAKVTELVCDAMANTTAPVIWNKENQMSVVQFFGRSDLLMVAMGCRTALDEMHRSLPYWAERDLMDETDHANTGT